MRITEKDWMLLSAYLDQELQGKQKLKFERRLEQDSDLRQVMKNLSRTINLLSQTPRLQVPRNFTLVEKQLPARKYKQPFFTYRLAAAVFSILLVGVLIFDSISLLGIKDAALVSAPVYQEEVLEEAPNLALDSAAGGQQEEIEKSFQEEAPAAEMEEAPEVESLAEGDLEPEPSAEIEQKAAESEMELGTVEGGNQEERAFPTPTEMSSEQLPAETAAAPETYRPEQEGFSLSPIRVVEILLGLGVIGFSMAAWRRRKS